MAQSTKDGRAALAERWISSAVPASLAKAPAADVQPPDLNGIELEDVIDVIVERLEWRQRGAFRCREYALTITKLEEARHWLDARRQRVGKGEQES
jgi:hypothetical protein